MSYDEYVVQRYYFPWVGDGPGTWQTMRSLDTTPCVFPTLEEARRAQKRVHPGIKTRIVHNHVTVLEVVE